MPFKHAVNTFSSLSLSLFQAHLLLFLKRILIQMYQGMWSLHVLLVFSESKGCNGGTYTCKSHTKFPTQIYFCHGDLL